MKKRTKIIATIGPATESKEVVRRLIQEGVNIFRFNLKHNEHSWHEDKINEVREIAKELDCNIGILADLQGPDVRMGEISKESLDLGSLKEVYLEKDLTEENSIQLKEKYLSKLKPNQVILIDDGKSKIVVKEVISPTKILASIEYGEVIVSKKGIFLPGLDLDMPALSEKDEHDITLAAKVKAEYVALSFVSKVEDLKNLKRVLAKHDYNPLIISKMETLDSIKNAEGIVNESNAIMVARGDLGVEISFERVPKVQKMLIEMCIKKGKPVIVATQMLRSMINSPIPTRAEANDVATAAFESADCVMLSEETATGKYPIKAVEFMAKALNVNETANIGNIGYSLRPSNRTNALLSAATTLQESLMKIKETNLVGFIVLTESGTTPRLLSSTRPYLPIYSFSEDDMVSKEMAIDWGVESYTMEFSGNIDKTAKNAIELLTKKGKCAQGDTFILVSGEHEGTPGQTNTIRIVTV